MADNSLVRLGGIFGLLSVVAMIPAYLVGSPDLPSSPEEAGSYFEEGLGTFVFFNGVLPLLHVLLGLVAALVGLLWIVVVSVLMLTCALGGYGRPTPAYGASLGPLTLYSPRCLEEVFSETYIQLCGSLCFRTGDKRRCAP